jgi:histidine triad (HIT) family protein
MPCLFCSIIAKSVPAHRVYEDDATLAFLDIHPVHPGHLLVIPKIHTDDLRTADGVSLAACIIVAQRLAHALEETLSCEGVNLLQNSGVAAGQVIPHLHFHLIPRWSSDGLRHWPGNDLASEEGTAIADRLRAAIRS